MIDRLVRAIVEHPKRKLLVIILTLVTGVVFVLPAVEEYSAARGRTAEARDRLQEASGAAAVLPQVRSTLAARQQELKKLEQKSIREVDVEKLRAELQELIREVGCEMREVYIEEVPNRRPWLSNDSPLHGAPIGNPGQETPFILVEWDAKIRIEGPMESVYKFLARVNQMDRFIHGKNVTLRRSDANEYQTHLSMELTLFDLERKKLPRNG